MTQTPQTFQGNSLRCIRNDGKTWRCSKRVMPGKKLCEHHHLKQVRRTLELQQSPKKPHEKKKKRQRRTHTLFEMGEEVEVTSQGDGLDGSWYVATITLLPKRKKDNYYLAEYHTLMEEQQGVEKRLVEVFHVSNIRPKPPSEEMRLFQLNDVVDAYYNDGWWQGVVNSVLEKEEKRYLVNFTDTKEEIEFGAADLRTHMEWIDGNWVRSQHMGEVEEGQVVQCRSEGGLKEVTQIIDEVEGLPPGWTQEFRVSKKGRESKYSYYIDPFNGYAFRNKTEVFRYLDSGKIGRHVVKKRGISGEESVHQDSPVTETIGEVNGLPPGWIREVRVKNTKNKSKYSGYAFRSKRAASLYLNSGKVGKRVWKRRCINDVESVRQDVPIKLSLSALQKQASRVPALEKKCKDLEAQLAEDSSASMKKWRQCFAWAVSQAEDDMAWASIKLALDVLGIPLTDLQDRLREISVEKGIQNPENAISSISPLYLFPERLEAVHSIWDSAVKSVFSRTVF